MESHILSTCQLLHFYRQLVVMGGFFVVITTSIAAPLQVDQQFGVDGLLVSLTSSADIYAQSSSSISSNGKITISKTCSTSSGIAACLLRFNENGQIDTSYGVGGTAVVSQNSTLKGQFFDASRSRSYLIAECAAVRSCITRFDANGAIDVSFGTAGWISVEAVVPGYYVRLGVSADNGDILTSGSCLRSGLIGLCIARWKFNGELDTSFGDRGIAFKNVTAELFSIVIASDGSVIAAGGCRRLVDGYTFFKRCFIKLTLNGQYDSAFGTDGLITNDGYQSTEWVSDMILDGSDRIVAVITGFGVGPSYGCQFGCNLIVRFLLDGTPDPSFTPPTRLWELGANAIAVDTSERYVVVSEQNCVTPASKCIARLLPNGTFDTSFSAQMDLTPIFTFSPPMYGAWPTRIGIVSANSNGNGWLIISSDCRTSDGEGQCVRKVSQQSSRFDVDSDGFSKAETDGVLYLRHLLGFRGSTLTSGALGKYASRPSSDDVTAYLQGINTTYPSCPTSVVGSPSGASAMLDGLVLLRTMLGLTGDAVVSGINFPLGTARMTWAEIKTHLSANCGMTIE